MQRFESLSVASEFWTCSKFRDDLMRPFCRIKQMRCIVQRKRHDIGSAKFAIAKCFKAVGSQLWQGLISAARSCCRKNTPTFEDEKKISPSTSSGQSSMSDFPLTGNIAARTAKAMKANVPKKENVSQNAHRPTSNAWACILLKTQNANFIYYNPRLSDCKSCDENRYCQVFFSTLQH